MSRARCNVAKKPRFPSQLEANLAIADIQRSNNHHRRRKFRDEPTRAYPCTACGGYHLTSQD